MNVAFCVEDDSDEFTYRLLIERLLETTVNVHEVRFRFRRGGWSNALKLAPLVVKRAAQSQLDGVVLAVDNDGVEPTHATHRDAPRHETCRACRLRDAARASEVASWNPHLRFAIGVPVQTIETWLLLLRPYPFPGGPEAMGHDPSGRSTLKKLLYGTDLPTRDRMQEVVADILAAPNLAELERSSKSFEEFAVQIRNFRVH